MKQWEKDLLNRRAAHRRRQGGRTSKTQRRVETEQRAKERQFDVSRAKAAMRSYMQAVEVAERPLRNLKADLQYHANPANGGPELFVKRSKAAVAALGKVETALSFLYDALALMENAIKHMR